MNNSTDTLVADIGGTHARFGMVRGEEKDRPAVHEVRQYLAARFDTLTAAIQHYFAEIGIAAVPGRALLSVASPVTGDCIDITNNPWRFSLGQLERELGIGSVDAINDFAAISHGVPFLTAEDLRVIGSAGGQSDFRRDQHSFAIVGPGTGLGVGAVMLRDGHATVVPSEGGHTSFAPVNRYELQVLDHLMSCFGRVSNERLLSGTGLANLHQAVCAIEGVAQEAVRPEDITARATQAPDGIEGRSVALFCEIFGSIAGDVALTFGAWSGVYLAGGVVSKLLPWLTAGGFRQRFQDKGRFEERMKSVPTVIIMHPFPGLLGAAAYLRNEVSLSRLSESHHR